MAPTELRVRTLNKVRLATADEAWGKKELEVWFESVPEAMRREVEERVSRYLQRDDVAVVAVEVRGEADNFRLTLRRQGGRLLLMFCWTGGHGRREFGALTLAVVLVDGHGSTPLVDISTVNLFDVEGTDAEE